MFLKTNECLLVSSLGIQGLETQHELVSIPEITAGVVRCPVCHQLDPGHLLCRRLRSPVILDHS